MKRPILSFFFILLLQSCFSRQTESLKREFCTNLHKVLESGRVENFESLPMALESTMPFMGHNGNHITLPEFPTLYLDKDSRFVAKTGLNMDSASALKELDTLKVYISSCLDSTWKWYERMGDDSTTVFFKEFKEYYATDGTLSLIIAMTLESGRVYSVNMFIKRFGRPPRRR